jgi:NADP-dependent aldehyde dehydrogenase
MIPGKRIVLLGCGVVGDDVQAMATTFNSVDPRTGEPGAAFEEATPGDVHAAAAAAAEAFRSPALRDREARAALLRGAAARLRAAGDEVVATAPDAKPIPRPDVRRMLVPIGPVAVFGASNFPLAFSTAGGDTASALAAGCPVVVKGHPSHPGTSALVARELRAAVADAGLPEGTFGHLTAAGFEVGEALVSEPAIAAVGFTGSYNGGRAIFDRAAARPQPIPVYAEMGSVNPIVVTEAALRERADAIAEGLTASVATSGGQLCTKPGVVFVPAGETGDAFAAAVASRLDAAEPSVLLNERLRDALREGVGRLGALAQVEPLTEAPGADGPGFRHQPSAYRAAARDLEAAPELLEEHFGPVVLFLSYGSRDELLAALDRVEGQLTGSLHAQPGEDVDDVVGALSGRAGRVVFDGFPTGVAVTYGMHHGGPFPATTAPGHTSVGMTAIRRFLRPVAFQNAPAEALPRALRDENPLGIWRRVDGELTREPLR